MVVVTWPTLRFEVAFAADPLAATYAKSTLTGSANSYLYTADANGLDITGDIDIVARLSMTDWTPAAESTIVAKDATGQRSYRLYVTTAGALTLAWTTDGSTVLSQASSVPAFTNGTTYWVRATLDVNDGAAGRNVTFYTAADQEMEPLNWTLLSTHTTAGTTSIYSGTSRLEIGSRNGGGTTNLAGDIYRVIIRNGIDGTVVADCDVADVVAAGDTSWYSSRVGSQQWLATNATVSVAPTWTDVSAYVRDEPVSTSRGKQTEIQTYASSSLSLTLSNRDRRFDPDYLSSPYSPNVQPRRRVRLRLTHDSTTYTLFTGYVESWPQKYPASNFDAVVELSAFDALGLLNDRILEDAAYLYANSISVSGKFVTALRRLSLIETYSSALWVNERDGVKSYQKRSGIVRTGSALAVGPSSPVAFNGATAYSYGPTSSAYGVSTTKGTWSFWMQTNGAGTDLTAWMIALSSYADASGSVTPARIGLDVDGYLRYKAGTSYTYSTSPVNDGAPHHIVVVEDAATGPKVYVDGVNATDVSSGATVYGPGTVSVVGDSNGAVSGDTLFDGTIQDVWCWVDQALTATQVAGLYRLGSGSYAETVFDRANRILDAAGIPGGLRAITDIPKATVADIDLYGQTALTQLQQLADSESGGAALFIDTMGRVALHDRYWWRSTPRGSTAQAVLSDDLADLYYSDVAADRNLREVQNAITVTGSGNLSATSTDTTSISTYGYRTASIATILSSQSQVSSLAVGLLALRKDPITRLDTILVKPAMQSTSWSSLLRLELGDRITFELMPARGVATTSQLVKSLIIERLDWQFTQSDWTLAITGSPVPTMSIFTLNSSLLDGTDVLGF